MSVTFAQIYLAQNCATVQMAPRNATTLIPDTLTCIYTYVNKQKHEMRL